MLYMRCLVHTICCVFTRHKKEGKGRNMVGISKIKKRDGSVVEFEKSKVENAIFKAARAVGGKDRTRECR